MNDKTPDRTQKIAPDRTKAIALGAMCLALFMTNFEGTAMDVALPQIQKNLGANVVGLQWVINAYLLPVASLLLVSGKLGDIFGRRQIFLIGLTLFTIASVICGFAPNLELLIAGRSLQGIGAAAVIPLSLTIVTAMFPDSEERTKAIGTWSAVSALAMVAGPGLGGLLVDTLGWQSIFLCNVPLSVITFILISRSFREDRNLTKQPLDLPGLLFSIIAIASLACLLTQGSTSAWLSPPTIGLLIVFGLSFLGFWIVESRSSHPIIPMTLLRNQTFAALISTQTLVFFASGGLFFILSLFLQQVQGYSAAATGLCFLPMNGAIILAAFTSGWIAARLGWRFPIISGLVMASVAILSLTQTHVDTKYGEILGRLVLSGFGGGLTIAPLATAAMNAVLPTEEGIASAVSSISIQFGGILGIAIQGAILSQRLSFKLRQSLIEWHVPTDLQDKIIAEALHNLAEVPVNIPSTISPLILHQEIRNAFVSGLHATLFIAGLAMLLGVGVILILVPSNLKPRSQV